MKLLGRVGRDPKAHGPSESKQIVVFNVAVNQLRRSVGSDESDGNTIYIYIYMMYLWVKILVKHSYYGKNNFFAINLFGICSVIVIF